LEYRHLSKIQNGRHNQSSGQQLSDKKIYKKTDKTLQSVGGGGVLETSTLIGTVPTKLPDHVKKKQQKGQKKGKVPQITHIAAKISLRFIF
jgi:hypothetical protein